MAISSLSVRRTTGVMPIRHLATDPRIFPHISDDFVTNPATWKAPTGDSIRYLVAADEQGDCGFSVFIARTWAMWEAHVAFLPRAYGEQALNAFKQMLAWMWAHTTASRIIGEIDIRNRRAISFSKRAGFCEYGVNEKSRLSGGLLRDQVCLGISRAETL